jgi:hypothetical protein
MGAECGHELLESRDMMRLMASFGTMSEVRRWLFSGQLGSVRTELEWRSMGWWNAVGVGERIWARIAARYPPAVTAALRALVDSGCACVTGSAVLRELTRDTLGAEPRERNKPNQHKVADQDSEMAQFPGVGRDDSWVWGDVDLILNRSESAVAHVCAFLKSISAYVWSVHKSCSFVFTNYLTDEQLPRWEPTNVVLHERILQPMDEFLPIMPAQEAAFNAANFAHVNRHAHHISRATLPYSKHLPTTYYHIELCTEGHPGLDGGGIDIIFVVDATLRDGLSEDLCAWSARHFDTDLCANMLTRKGRVLVSNPDFVFNRTAVFHRNNYCCQVDTRRINQAAFGRTSDFEKTVVKSVSFAQQGDALAHPKVYIPLNSSGGVCLRQILRNDCQCLDIFRERLVKYYNRGFRIHVE